MGWFWIGLLAVLAGGAMQGSFAVPQKFVRGWAWEKTWLLYSITAMVIFPWLLVALLVPHAAQVYAGAGGGVLARTLLFGAGWGIGAVLFGLGMAHVGIALGFAIIISLTAAVGSLVPLAVLHPEQLGSRRGALLIIGLLVVIAGVVLCARAGALKQAGSGAAGRGGFGRGLAICIASGITSPMLNFAFSFGTPIADRAVSMGARASTATIAIFALAITAGFLINAGYCLYLLDRNRSWSKGLPEDRTRNTLLATAMGFLWLFGFFFYGLGATWLGALGPTVGWPILMTSMVLVANVWGLVTGEWTNAPTPAYRNLAGGLTLMIAALVIIGAASR